MFENIYFINIWLYVESGALIQATSCLSIDEVTMLGGCDGKLMDDDTESDIIHKAYSTRNITENRICGCFTGHDTDTRPTPSL